MHVVRERVGGVHRHAGVAAVRLGRDRAAVGREHRAQQAARLLERRVARARGVDLVGLRLRLLDDDLDSTSLCISESDQYASCVMFDRTVWMNCLSVGRTGVGHLSLARLRAATADEERSPEDDDCQTDVPQ